MDFKNESNEFTNKIHSKEDFEKLRNNCIIKYCLFNDGKTLTLFGLPKKILNSDKSFLGFVNSLLKEYGLIIQSSKKLTKNK